MSGPRRAALALALALAGCQGTVPRPEATTGEPPDLARVNTELGVQYLLRGDLETALARLERAVQIDADYAPAHDALGLLEARLGRNDRAEEHFERALALQPEASGTRNNYAQFLCSIGRRQEAEAMFALAVANPLYATPEVAHANAGLCALDAGDTDGAERHFRSALQADPRMPLALLEMADLVWARGEALRARAYLQRYAEAAEPSARALLLGVRVERALGDRDAESAYALALERRFPDAEETRILGELR